MASPLLDRLARQLERIIGLPVRPARRSAGAVEQVEAEDRPLCPSSSRISRQASGPSSVSRPATIVLEVAIELEQWLGRSSVAHTGITIK